MMRIVFVMGCTCAGKSRFLDKIRQELPDVCGLVEVGKMLRAIHPPEFFEGQAAPEKTRAEALRLCLEGIRGASASGKRVVFVDGQPRSVDQVDAMHTLLPEFPNKVYALFHTSLEVRQDRLRRRFPDPKDAGSLTLGMQRLTNDMQTYYTVLAELMRRNVQPRFFDTTDPDLAAIAMNLMYT